MAIVKGPLLHATIFPFISHRSIMNISQLNKLTLKIRKPQAAQSTIDIHNYLDKHRLFVERKFNNFIKLFEDCFDDLNVSIYHLNYVKKNKWPKHRGVQYLFFPETIKTLHRAFEDAVDGYYHESITLTRSVFESYLRMVFMSLYPTDWESIFHNFKNRRQFDATNLMKEHLKVSWPFIYRIMCKSSHSKTHHHSSKIINLSQNSKQLLIQLEYFLDNKLLAMCVNYLTFDLTLLFHMFMTLFYCDFSSSPELRKSQKHLCDVDRVLLETIKHNPHKDFSNISNEIIKVGNIVKAADCGKNWEKLA